MLARASHPVVHPAPMAVEAAQGQGQAPDAAAQGQGQAPDAAAQGQAQGQGLAPDAAAQGQGPAPDAAAQGQAQAPPQAPAAAVAEQGGHGNAPPPEVLMEDLLWAPGTRCGLGNRLAQTLLAVATVAFMASTSDFHVVTAYRYLVAAAFVQCLWSFFLAIVDLYALLVKRSLRTPRLTIIFLIGDWVTETLFFTAASGSAAITLLIDDMRMCSKNHCPSFRAATVLAFLSWCPIALSCLFNLVAAIHRVQSP